MQTAEPLRPRDKTHRIEPPKRPRSWKELRFRPQPSVRWFSPGVLTGAGLRVLVSAAFGSYLDKRELQGALPADSFAHRVDARELWIDFVADTGDGFATTYTIAWLTSQRELPVAGVAEPLPRPTLLVLGGDEVYPSGSPRAYEDRFVLPFRAALPWVEPLDPDLPLPPDHPLPFALRQALEAETVGSEHWAGDGADDATAGAAVDPTAEGDPTADDVVLPDYYHHLLALAGNHDWYDGLSSFVRLFCQGRWIGARHTRQSRSYFAVLLPHRWWMWGIDIQFDAYLDDPQIRYFEKVLTDDMRPGDRLILCTGKPSWTDLRENPDACRNLGFLERLIEDRGVRLMLTLTGDHHHYARYESEEGTHKITAGGGGAFLHPTHDLPDEFTLDIGSEQSAPQRFELRSCYPSRTRSRLLSLGALALPLRNPSFMAIPAVVYVLLAWASQFGIRALDEASDLPLDQVAPTFGFGDLALGLVRNPNSVVLALVFLIGLIGFAKPPARFAQGRSGLAAKSLMGTVHGAMHLVASLLVNLAAIRLAAELADGGWFTLWLFVFVGVLGGIAGGLVMGLYLTVSVATPGWEAHGNEAFSAVRLTCNKNFLRMHLDTDGRLVLYPVGVDRSVLRWKFDPDNPDQGAPWLAPVGGPPTAHLIEGPIVVDGRAPGGAPRA